METLVVFISITLPWLVIPGFLVFFIVRSIKERKKYETSTYFSQTKIPYREVKRDLGKYGEYLIYKDLLSFEEAGGKFLFNVYIPKGKFETTEIDVLLITSKGLFVFESKNYSGWIFGNETQRNWTQTLPQYNGNSNKVHFYNPIMQNRTHINHLRILIGQKVPVRSVIVFSERCTLKNVKVNSEDIRVINRYDVASALASLCKGLANEHLSVSEINHLYNLLFLYTQVNQEQKEQHIENIKSNTSRTYDCGDKTVGIAISDFGLKRYVRSVGERLQCNVDVFNVASGSLSYVAETLSKSGAKFVRFFLPYNDNFYVVIPIDEIIKTLSVDF